MAIPIKGTSADIPKVKKIPPNNSETREIGIVSVIIIIKGRPSNKLSLKPNHQ